MSLIILKSIIMNIGQKVKKFLSNIWDLLGQWFQVAEQAIKDNIHVAVILTENIKKFIDNPVGDFLLTVIDDKIPGDISGKVKELLPKVLLGLNIINDCKDMPESEALICIASKLQVASNENKDMFFRELSLRIAKELSDGQFTISDIIGIVEWYYRTQVKK